MPPGDEQDRHGVRGVQAGERVAGERAAVVRVERPHGRPDEVALERDAPRRGRQPRVRPDRGEEQVSEVSDDSPIEIVRLFVVEAVFVAHLVRQVTEDWCVRNQCSSTH